MNDQKSLPALRQEIRELTKSILALSEARQTVSLQIAETKKRSGLKIENAEVEEELVASMLEYSVRIGLDPELARKIVLSLIEASKTAQRELIHRKEIQSFLESQKIRRVSIVGAGRMGTWFAQYFARLKVPVLLYDENKSKSKSRAKELSVPFGNSLKDAVATDLMIIAVPIAKTPRTIREIAGISGTSRGGRLKLMEISSVKSEVAGADLIGKSSSRSLNRKLELYSIHPLFGAAAESFGKNAIIQVSPSDTRFIKGIFPHFSVLSLDWKTHDELMGLFLTIPHAFALVFADLLAGKNQVSHVNVKTPSYEHILELSRKVLRENPEVYFEIQASNPFTDRALKEVASSFRKLRKSLDSRSEFVKFFNDAGRAVKEKS